MNPVSATALYVSASRAVLQCDPRRPHTFTDMYTLLPFFRQALSCLVCGKLLQDPVTPAHPDCQHHVCSACRGERSRARPACGRCRDESCLRENKTLSLLVESYRKLLLYVTHSPLLPSISSCVGGSPEVLSLLEEVLMAHGEELEAEDPPQQAPSPAPKSLPPIEAPPALVALSVVPLSSSSDPPCSNGVQGCNGDVLEVPSSPELEVCELVEEPLLTGLISSSGCGGPELSLIGPLAPGIVCSLRDGEVSSRELEEGEVLLLSVEEVLQTLDPLQPSRDSPHIQQTFIRLDTAHNYTHIPALGPPPASKPPPVRLKRKRSHSESDREKIKPLPISSILQGSSPLQMPLTAPHPIAAPAHTNSSLPNRVPPKPSRPPPHSKTVRKNVDPGTKKPHAKPRSTGGPRTKDGGRDQRLMPGCLLPAAPIRPPYKKPAEKRGCKCGRATQNPSVLTCRGQRCPCYSNRKACLDCICRGCQNSFMANGEKKLEAFAVPEKALEQTRLTLGINLTSITALRSPPTATILNVSTATGSPITTAFLSPSPSLTPSYEDSLELLIG